MIERLVPPVSEADLHALALLLVDAVESGAAVSFLSLTESQALDWWRRQFAAPASGTVVLIARDAHGIAGSVQLHPAWAPNQPHRADVSKLIVHRVAVRVEEHDRDGLAPLCCEVRDLEPHLIHIERSHDLSVRI